MFYDCVTDVLMERRYATCKLNSKTCDELSSISDVSTTSRKEEASAETMLVEECTGDSSGNGRLPGAGPIMKPKDALSRISVRPLIYISKKADAGVGKANRFMVFVVRIKRRVGSVREAGSVMSK